jgi:hypothetical protein
MFEHIKKKSELKSHFSSYLLIKLIFFSLAQLIKIKFTKYNVSCTKTGKGLASPLSFLLIVTQLCAASSFLPDLITYPPVYHLLHSLFASSSSSSSSSADDNDDGNNITDDMKEPYDDDGIDGIDGPQSRRWKLYSL